MIDRNEVAVIARSSIALYVDAQYECEDLAECQTAAVLETVDRFCEVPQSSPETEQCLVYTISDAKAVCNQLGEHPVERVRVAVEILSAVRLRRLEREAALDPLTAARIDEFLEPFINKRKEVRR